MFTNGVHWTTGNISNIESMPGGEQNGYSSANSEDPAVTRLREYMRIKTMHPDPDYGMFN